MNKEDVKKILEHYFSEELGEGASDDIAEEICQLESKPYNQDDAEPDTFELPEPAPGAMERIIEATKPDEGRLLTDEEIDALDAEFSMEELGSHAHEDKLLKAQRDLTASINDAEIRKLILEYEFALENKDAECQARVEKIFEEGGSLCPHRKPYSLKRRCFTCWQALKKKELK